jgi:sialate O-acetylesterase
MKLPRLHLPLALILVTPLHAALKLPAIVSDHMVLQQKQTNPIWGWDTPGTRVMVEFASRSHNRPFSPPRLNPVSP